MALARLKNDAVQNAYPGECEGSVILSADTVVWSPAPGQPEWNMQGNPHGFPIGQPQWQPQGQPIGKPKDADDARRMLRALSGTSHFVVTGVMLRFSKAGRVRESLFAEETEVCFRPLSEDEIDRYVKSGDPMDKAGAYGIQNLGSMLVESLRGDYFTVMGLPVCRLAQALKRFGLDPLLGQEKKP